MARAGREEEPPLESGGGGPRRQPMQFAVVLGKRHEDHRLSLHASRSGRSLAKVLREESGHKLVTWGVTEVDDSRRDTLVLVLEDRVLGGMTKKLQAWLKLMGAPIRKVATNERASPGSSTDDSCLRSFCPRTGCDRARVR